MAVIQGGSGTTNIANVSGNFALSTQLIPTAGGQYSAGWETTAAGLAFTNNVVVWDFRNASANLVLITNVMAQVNAMGIAAAVATGLKTTLRLFVGRSYTVQSTTNATALTLTTNNCKLRTSYATPGVQIGTASATGGITGGTITEDASSLADAVQGALDESITAAASPGANQHRSNDRPLAWTPNPFGGPIVLAANEGIRIRYLVTTAATVVVGGQVQWSELGSTTYP